MLTRLNEMIESILPVEYYRNSKINITNCLISATTDIEAINCWLAEYQKSPSTYRNYLKEAERFLLWLIIDKKKKLSQITGDDLLVYGQFLENPQPHDYWCGPKLARKGKRGSKEWKPFVGPLSLNAKIAAFKSLASLFNYLTEVNYLDHNPMLPVRRQLKQNYSLEEQKWRVTERIIDIDDWVLMQEVIQNMPENNGDECWEKIRLKLLIAYLYFTSLRIHELSSHVMNAFRKIHDFKTGKDRWWLFLIGKGGKPKKIPVNSHLLEVLIAYRRYLDLPDLPELDESEPLIRSSRGGQALSDRRLNQIIKSLAEEVAIKYDSTNPEKALKLRKFSAHWMRHLSLSIQGHLEMSRQNIKENAGHENMQTTEIYLHALDNQRHDEMEKLQWQPNFKLANEKV